MKLFNLLTVAVVYVAAGPRNEEVPSDVHQQLKKACKSQIRNKVESEKFAEKLERCLNKKTAKYLKKQEKSETAQDRQQMKQEINQLKQEKAEAKEERNKCKDACMKIADQRTKQNCLDYWNTASREKIQEILEQVKDKRERSSDDTSYCLTDAGLTGTETTCKDHAIEFCDDLGLERPSKAIRDCRSACLGDCMVGDTCDWSLSDSNTETED